MNQRKSKFRKGFISILLGGILLDLYLLSIFVGSSFATPPSQFSCAPATALDAYENIHVVYNEYGRDNNRVHYMKLDKDGNVIIPPMLLPYPMYAAYADIVVDSDNCPHIFYSVYEQNYAHPIPAGINYVKLTLSGKIIFTQNLLRNFSHPHAAIDSKDRIYLIWREVDGYHYSSFNKSGEQIVNDETESPEGYEIVVDYQQYDIYVLEEGYHSEKFRWHFKPHRDYSLITTLNGKKLSILNSGGHDYHEAHAADSDGNIHIFYRPDDLPEVVDDYYLYYEKININGQVLVNHKKLSDPILFPGNPTVEIDKDNQIHIIWHGCGDLSLWDMKGKESGVFYMKINKDGNILRPITSLTPESKPDFPVYFVLLTITVLIVVTSLIYKILKIKSLPRYKKVKGKER